MPFQSYIHGAGVAPSHNGKLAAVPAVELAPGKWKYVAITLLADGEKPKVSALILATRTGEDGIRNVVLIVSGDRVAPSRHLHGYSQPKVELDKN